MRFVRFDGIAVFHDLRVTGRLQDSLASAAGGREHALCRDAAPGLDAQQPGEVPTEDLALVFLRDLEISVFGH